MPTSEAGDSAGLWNGDAIPFSELLFSSVDTEAATLGAPDFALIPELEMDPCDATAEVPLVECVVMVPVSMMRDVETVIAIPERELAPNPLLPKMSPPVKVELADSILSLPLADSFSIIATRPAEQSIELSQPESALELALADVGGLATAAEFEPKAKSLVPVLRVVERPALPLQPYSHEEPIPSVHVDNAVTELFDHAESQDLTQLFTRQVRAAEVASLVQMVSAQVPSNMAPFQAGQVQLPGSAELNLPPDTHNPTTPIPETHQRLSKLVVAQVADAWSKLDMKALAINGRELSIHVYPAELGRVHIIAAGEADRMRVQIVTSEWATVDLINKEKPQLVAALREQGIESPDIDVSHRSPWEHDGSPQDQAAIPSKRADRTNFTQTVESWDAISPASASGKSTLINILA